MDWLWACYHGGRMQSIEHRIYYTLKMSKTFSVLSSPSFLAFLSLLISLTHEYSVGVAVSYSWDFLICIKFCETIVIVLNPAACFARLVCI